MNVRLNSVQKEGKVWNGVFFDVVISSLLLPCKHIQDAALSVQNLVDQTGIVYI